MRTFRLFLLLLAATFAVVTPRSAPAQVRAEVSFDFFYDSLAPYGEWLEVADYGPCWRPLAVDENWAPYMDGYWAFTDAGWTWVSYEEFGGIVYHYGRWVRVEDEGWCWVPGYEWGPAWVSWRESDDYIGWAPLPPEAYWRPEIGLSVWVDREFDIGPAYYHFCHVRDFGAPVLRPVIVNRSENVTIIRRTVNITNITYNTTYVNAPVIYNGGPNYTAINRRVARPVPAFKLVLRSDFDGRRDRDGRDERERHDGRRGDFNAQAVGNQLVVTAPVVRPPRDRDEWRPRIKKTVTADKVSRGWNVVKSEDARRELREEMQRQTKGKTSQTTPARPVAAAELKPLPEKADSRVPSQVTDTRERRGPSQPGEPAAQPPMRKPDSAPAETEKTAREKDRGRRSQEPGAPVLKPFDPAAEKDPAQERKAPTAVAPPAPSATEPQGVAREKDRLPKGRRMPSADESNAAETAARESQRQQAETLRAREREQAAVMERQKTQAEQETAARRQNEDAIKRQEQMEKQQRDAEAAKAAAVEKMRQQEQLTEMRRRENAAMQAGEQRRQLEQQQRAAQEAQRQQREQAEVGERARQAKEAQRQQMERAAGEQQRRQREQAEVGERARQAQEGQRQQMERAAGEQRRQREQAEAGERARQAQEGQRQQIERAAGEQRRQREQNEAAEQGRRAQDAQREQMRQQMEAQRAARESQRPPAPNPENAPERRGKDRKE